MPGQLRANSRPGKPFSAAAGLAGMSLAALGAGDASEDLAQWWPQPAPVVLPYFLLQPGVRALLAVRRSQ